MQNRFTSLNLKQIQWVCWIILFVIHVLSILPYDPIGQAILYSLINICSYLVIIYGNASFLMPKLYEKKRLLWYVLPALLFVILVAVLRFLISFWIYNHWYAPQPAAFNWSGISSTLISCLLIYLTSILFYLSLKFFKLQQKQETLLKKNAEAELNLLKSQVQPHFLFNTLNNIYYVAQRESPATASLIEHLSLIMRYFVDEAPRSRISLETEMNFIKNYISLETLRMRFPMQVNIQDTGLPDSLMVPAMLLIPLVENVFKHGIDKGRNDNFILIRLAEKNNRLEVRVTNRLPDDIFAKNAGGTGLANLFARLELIYGTDFVLETKKQDSQYMASLNIPL